MIETATNVNIRMIRRFIRKATNLFFQTSGYVSLDEPSPRSCQVTAIRLVTALYPTEALASELPQRSWTAAVTHCQWNYCTVEEDLLRSSWYHSFQLYGHTSRVELGFPGRYTWTNGP